MHSTATIFGKIEKAPVVLHLCFPLSLPITFMIQFEILL